MAELEIRHTTRKIETPPQAFAMGFAEGFGKAWAWAIVIGVALWAFDQIKGDDEPDAARSESVN